MFLGFRQDLIYEYNSGLQSCLASRPSPPVVAMVLNSEKTQLKITSTCKTNLYGLDLTLSYGTTVETKDSGGTCIPSGPNNSGIMNVQIPVSPEMGGRADCFS